LPWEAFPGPRPEGDHYNGPETVAGGLYYGLVTGSAFLNQDIKPVHDKDRVIDHYSNEHDTSHEREDLYAFTTQGQTVKYPYQCKGHFNKDYNGLLE
jgi:hypothetical protein